MAQTTNTSNSADYQSMVRSTTPSEDEDHFLTPSSDIDFSPLNGVVHQYSPVENNQTDTDSIDTEDLSQSTTLMIPTYHNYSNLSASSSETSLARPLLSEKTHAIPLYTEDVKVTSASKVTSSFQSNYCAFLKLYLADMFVSAFAITPLVNIHWRGAWDLLDICLLPDHPRISAFVSLGTGLAILYVLYLTQSLLQGIYERNRKKLLGHLLTRFYNLLMAFAYINQWRGLWNLLDMTSNNWQQLVIELVISIVVLLLMKSTCNLNSAPFLTATDTESCLLIGSKYTVSSKRFCQYTFDFVLYELVEAPFVVIAWRGLYNLSDLYLFAESKSLSMLVSFTIGYALFFLLALLQIPLIRCLMNKSHPHAHSILSHGSHLIAFVSVVQIWRSLWMMCEQYINIPGYHLLTLWLCYTLAYVVLTCGLAAWSLNGPGGAKDAYIDDQPIFLFKFDYFSTLLKNPSDHLAASGSNILGSDLSSTESIVPQECPYGFQPP